MVLIVGATGLVGSEICRDLAERGEKVRALVRSSSSPDKVAVLRQSGAEICTGDLKDAQSLASACSGVNAVISTASSTLSRQPGDSIESVDLAGQLDLVSVAKAAGVRRFVLVSFPHPTGLSFPLGDAKREVEAAITGFDYTIVHANWFMEVWLSPALGFDFRNAAARIYGAGTNPLSWVSFFDVAKFCALALRHPAASRRTIEFGGPTALSPLEVVARFERATGRKFQVEHVPEQALQAQFESAPDSMQKSFAALMLLYAAGCPMNMQPVIDEFGIKLTSVEDYAGSAIRQSATV